MNNLNLHVFVNTKDKQILDVIQKLPENWRNINGLDLHSEEKLSDLGWAGHDDHAWIPFDKFNFNEYTYADGWLEISKNNIKTLIEKEKIKALDQVLSWNGNDFIFNNDFKINLSFALTTTSNLPDINQTFTFLNGTKTLSKDELTDISKSINQYIESVSNAELSMIKLIDSINNIEELQTLNIIINWPSTTLS